MTKISPEDLELLKQPLGRLIPDDQVTEKKIVPLLNGAKKIITVGDATTARLVSFGVIPDISVIDGLERRSQRNYPVQYRARQLECANPAGTISREAVTVLKKALKISTPVQVNVIGEEDLLALALLAISPEGSIVLYGQPLEGLVIVLITPTKRRLARELMDRICDN